jgi:putative transposase
LRRGCDGPKRLSGRKRFVVCDTLGLWLEVVGLPASVPERARAERAFWRLAEQKVCAVLEVVWADAGFERRAGQEKVEALFGFCIEIVKRCGGASGFEVLPKRWIVERSFGWMNFYRCLSKDHKGHTHLSRDWLLWVMTDKMLHTLHPQI